MSTFDRSRSSSAMVDELLGILGDYVSGINARSLLARSADVRTGGRLALDSATLPGVLARVEAGAMLFTRHDRRLELQTRLEHFRQKHLPPKAEAELIPIGAEADIVIARGRARALCTAMGARNVGAHKVATVVSELARNIVSYTPGGSIELEPHDTPPAVTVRARDEGGGIPNLNEILSGTYRSKTGLGLGIAGSRRLAESFDIQTGPGGTLVVMKIAL